MESAQKERIPVANLFSTQGKTAIVTGGILGPFNDVRRHYGHIY